MNSSHPLAPPPSDAYTGVDNLEVMQEAVNYNRYLLDAILEQTGANSHVLDFGAGTGQFALALRQRAVDVIAVEPDSALRNRLATHGVPAYASATELPASTFDLIYSLNVLEHIEDDARALRQLHTCLRPRGRLLVYVPAFMLLYTSMDAKVGHVRRYSRAGLRNVVSGAGFDIEHLGYVDSLGFPATLLFKLADRGGGQVNRTALKLYDRLVFPVSRALDLLMSRWFGKNLMLVACKH